MDSKMIEVQFKFIFFLTYKMSKTKRLVEEAKWFILHDKPEDFEELILQIIHETSNDNGFLPSDKHYSYFI